MKPLLLSIVAVFLSLHGTAQIVSSCTPSARLIHAYENECRYLALQDMYNIGSPDTSFIEIPAVYYDSVLAGMAAIYNTGSAISADSVFEIYCVHEYRIPYYFIGHCSPGFSWPPGSPIAIYCHQHGVTISSESSSGGGIRFTADHFINLKAFQDSLAFFPDVFGPFTPQYYIGGGDHVTYTSAPLRTYAFQLAWGDCMSGCNNGKTWTYSVDTLCNVALVSVIPQVIDPTPAPHRNCNLNPLAINAHKNKGTARVYPNPAKSELSIELPDDGDVYPYTITDVLGKRVSSGIVSGKAIIDMKQLPSGVYMLTLNNRYYTNVVRE